MLVVEPVDVFELDTEVLTEEESEFMGVVEADPRELFVSRTERDSVGLTDALRVTTKDFVAIEVAEAERLTEFDGVLDVDTDTLRVPRDETDELDVIETEADVERDGHTLYVPNREADLPPDNEEVTVGEEDPVEEALVFADFEALGEGVDDAETEGDLEVVTEPVFVEDGDVLFVDVFETILVNVHEAVFVDVADTVALRVCADVFDEEVLADVVFEGALLGLEAAEREGDFVDVADFVLVAEVFEDLDVVDEGDLRPVDVDDKDEETVGVYDIVLTDERVP